MRTLVSRLLVVGLAALVVLVGVVVAVRMVPARAVPLTAAATRESLETTVELSGSVVARDTRTLGFGTGGTVGSLTVGEGDRVAAGDVLATIDDTLVSAQIEAAAAAVKSAEARLAADRAGPTKLERSVAKDPIRQAQRSLAAASTAYRDVRAQQNAAVELARAQRDAAKAQLAADTAAGASPSVVAADSAAFEAAQAAVRRAKLQRTAAGHQASASVAAASSAVTAATHAYRARVAKAPRALIAADEAAVASAALSLATARQALDLATIRAPVEGTVTEIGFEVGDRVGPSAASASALGPAASLGGSSTIGSGTIELMTLDDLRVDSTASEIDVAQLRLGQSVRLSFEALPDATLNGRVCELGRVGSLAEGVVEYPVTICLTDRADDVRVGMSADGSIPVARRDGVIVIPSEAVHEVDGRTFVDVLGDDGVIRSVDIETGLASGSRIEVTSGLREGQNVVLPALQAE